MSIRVPFFPSLQRLAIRPFFVSFLACATCTVWYQELRADAVGEALGQLGKVEKQGKLNAPAMQAWQTVQSAPATEIGRILSAIPAENPLAANWIRSAAEVILDRAAQQKQFPTAALEAFYADRQHLPRARRMAYELLQRSDPSYATRWLPQALDDPSLEMRRDAVAVVLQAAQTQLTAETSSSNPDHAASLALFRQALQAARDLDQVKLAAEELRKLGQTVDYIQHFGFLTQWQVVGPFDNRGRKGLEQAYGPETDPQVWASDTSLPSTITYPGLEGDVTWKDYQSSAEFGDIDFNQAVAKRKEIAAYARTIVQVPRAQEVELRLTSVNAAKIWLNGQLVLNQVIYHSGSEFDQYIVKIPLQAGPNVMLVKLCQNEQTESWTEDWKFQLRLCDSLGSPFQAKP